MSFCVSTPLHFRRNRTFKSLSLYLLSWQDGTVKGRVRYRKFCSIFFSHLVSFVSYCFLKKKKKCWVTLLLKVRLLTLKSNLLRY